VGEELFCCLDVLEPGWGVGAGWVGHEEDDWDEAGLEEEVQHVPSAQSRADVIIHVLRD